MANNPYVNKVEYGGQTLVDLTGDTVTPENMIRGTTAHDRSGAQIVGTYDPTSIIDDTAGAGVTDKTWSADKLSKKISQTIEGTIARETSAFSFAQRLCVKTGNVVTVSLVGTASNMAGVIGFASLPEGFRPPRPIYTRFYCTYVGTTGFFDGLIDNDGMIRLIIGSGTVEGTVTLLPVSYGV